MVFIPDSLRYAIFNIIDYASTNGEVLSEIDCDVQIVGLQKIEHYDIEVALCYLTINRNKRRIAWIIDHKKHDNVVISPIVDSKIDIDYVKSSSVVVPKKSKAYEKIKNSCSNNVNSIIYPQEYIYPNNNEVIQNDNYTIVRNSDGLVTVIDKTHNYKIINTPFYAVKVQNIDANTIEIDNKIAHTVLCLTAIAVKLHPNNASIQNNEFLSLHNLYHSISITDISSIRTKMIYEYTYNKQFFIYKNVLNELPGYCPKHVVNVPCHYHPLQLLQYNIELDDIMPIREIIYKQSEPYQGVFRHKTQSSVKTIGIKGRAYNNKCIPIFIGRVDLTLPQNNKVIHIECSCKKKLTKNYRTDITMWCKNPLIPDSGDNK